MVCDKFMKMKMGVKGGHVWGAITAKMVENKIIVSKSKQRSLKNNQMNVSKLKQRSKKSNKGLKKEKETKVAQTSQKFT